MEIPGLPGKSQDEHRLPTAEEKKAARAAGESGGDLPEEWKFKIAEAAAQAKQKGQLSAFLNTLVEGLLESKVDWRSQLLKYISSMLPFNYTWSRPSRRSTSVGFYLPSAIKENLEVVVHIDSSGSIGKETLVEFLSEIRGILTGFQGVQMTLLICDCALQQVYELTPDNVPELESLPIGGRGGTSHEPVVDWVLEHKPQSRILISLTDGYSDIERCYERLPDMCDKLILLDNQSSGMKERLEGYGEIICLGDL